MFKRDSANLLLKPVGKVKDDILNRLFYSSLQTSRFDEAYSALYQIGDNALYVAY